MLICRNRNAKKNMFHKNCHLQTKIIIIDMLKLLLYHINSTLLNMSWSNMLLLKRHLFFVWYPFLIFIIFFLLANNIHNLLDFAEINFTFFDLFHLLESIVIRVDEYPCS